MKTLKDFDFKDKKVLLRTDFNVPLSEQGEVADDFRIRMSVPTIEELLKRNASIIIISHSGRPGEKDTDRRNLSLKPIAERLERLLGREVRFLDDCLGRAVEEEASRMKRGDVLLLENLRFYSQEKENDEGFAKALASLADIFINDAFAVCHRSHASIVEVPRFLPSAAGPLLQKEIRVLSQFLENPERPSVGIIGGAKVSTKIKLIPNLLKKVDHLLLGGKMANDIMAVKGISTNLPLPDDEKTVKSMRAINLSNPKIHLPMDLIVSPDKVGNIYTRVAGPGEIKKDELALDIGPKTVDVFSSIIKEAKTVFWNGSLGMAEQEKFSSGSLGVASAIAQSQAFSILGGNDTVAFVRENALQDGFSHLSTGGGAMLEFLSKGHLVGLSALK